MNTFSKMTGLIAVATASVGAALLFSAPANASSSMLQQKCFGSSKAIVEHCCTAWVQSHGRPLWMWDTNTSCGQVVGCAAAAPKKPAIEALIFIPRHKAKNPCGIEIPTFVAHGSNTPPGTTSTVSNATLHH